VNRYQNDPHVLGTSIALDRKIYSIIGVMPRSFSFPPEDGRLDQSQLWIPMSLTADELSDQHAGFWDTKWSPVLSDGVTLAQAAGDADRVSKQVTRNLPTAQSAVPIRGDVTPLLEYDVAEARPVLRMLFLAVSVILLIGCFNVAGLMLVRAIRRRGEYALRLALGARSGVIIRESVLEGLFLGAGGGVLGLAFAAIAIRTTLHLLPESMPRVDSISIDATVAAFALLLALATGVLCGLAPVFTALRTNLTENLKEGAGVAQERRSTRGCGRRWLPEIAIALVLLTVPARFWQLTEDASGRSRLPS
jgi:putative ABC transport system permease protein